MTYFQRTVRLALQHHWTIAGILVSSLGVALLWGVNIGAVYPFVQCVFEGRSMHEWIDGQIELSQDECDSFNQNIAA